MWQTDECLLWGLLFLMSGLQDTCTQFDPIRYGRGYSLDFVDGCSAPMEQWFRVKLPLQVSGKCILGGPICWLTIGNTNKMLTSNP